MAAMAAMGRGFHIPGLPALPRLSAAARASQRRTRRHSQSRGTQRSSRQSRQSRQSRFSVLRQISHRMLQDGGKRWEDNLHFPLVEKQFTNSKEFLVFHPRICLQWIRRYYLARFNTNVNVIQGWSGLLGMYDGTDAGCVRFSWYYLNTDDWYDDWHGCDTPLVLHCRRVVCMIQIFTLYQIKYFHDSMIFFCHRLMLLIVIYTSWLILYQLCASMHQRQAWRLCRIGVMSLRFPFVIFVHVLRISCPAARQAVKNPDQPDGTAPWRWEKLSRTARRWSHGSLCKNRTRTSCEYLWNM